VILTNGWQTFKGHALSLFIAANAYKTNLVLGQVETWRPRETIGGYDVLTASLRGLSNAIRRLRDAVVVEALKGVASSLETFTAHVPPL
jgi:hypothetical protein